MRAALLGMSPFVATADLQLERLKFVSQGANQFHGGGNGVAPVTTPMIGPLCHPVQRDQSAKLTDVTIFSALLSSFYKKYG